MASTSLAGVLARLPTLSSCPWECSSTPRCFIPVGNGHIHGRLSSRHRPSPLVSRSCGHTVFRLKVFRSCSFLHRCLAFFAGLCHILCGGRDEKGWDCENKGRMKVLTALRFGWPCVTRGGGSPVWAHTSMVRPGRIGFFPRVGGAKLRKSVGVRACEASSAHVEG